MFVACAMRLTSVIPNREANFGSATVAKFWVRGEIVNVSGMPVNSYVDGPRMRGFLRRIGDMVRCSHMSGPYVRHIWPLALMEFADRVPIKNAR